MRNVSTRYCSSSSSIIHGGIASLKGHRSDGLTFSNILREMRDRMQHKKGIPTRRELILLRECRYFAAMEQASRLKDGASAQSHSVTNSLESLHSSSGSNSHAVHRKNALRHVLRRIAEFIASTGNCVDIHSPLHCGYDDLTTSNGLRRSELVLRLTEAALTASNDRMASIVALTFGRHTHTYEEETTPAVDTDIMPLLDFGSETTATMMDGDDVDSHIDATAPLTSMEVVALLRWSTWHIRTALNGLQENGFVSIHCMQLVVSLMSRLLCLIADIGLRCGAVETVVEELEVSDMGYAVADQALRVLYSNAALLASASVSSPAVAELFNEASSGSSNEHNIDTATTNTITITTETYHDTDEVWHSLRIPEETQQALLCSQRERWQRALELLLRTQRWNTWLDAKSDTPAPLDTTVEEMGAFETKVLPILMSAPRPVLQTLHYILAQHGQWSFCRQLWKETVSQSTQKASASSSPPAAALHSPFNVDNIITALAFVNAKPSPSSSATATVEGKKDAAELQAKPLLRLLLHLGIVPHRALSAAEFAALLRQSFGVPLGCSDPIEGILSPSFVWRRAAAHPHRVRATLCLLCFQVVVKSGLMHTVTVEDLYVVTSVLRQFLQRQVRGSLRESAVYITDEEEKEKEEDCLLGLLPATFAAATRRTAMTSAEAHICAITDVFIARRQEFIPVKVEEVEANMKGIQKDLQGDTMHAITTTTVTAAANKKQRMDSRMSKSAVMLSLLSRELMTLLAMAPYGNVIGVTWQAALCAISNEIERDGLDSHSARAVEGLASAMAKKVMEPGGKHLLKPLLRLSPYVSPFTVSSIIQSPVGNLLTWEQSLQLLPCTPWASNVQRRLLRRVVEERDATELPCVQRLMQELKLPPRLLHAYPTLVTDMRMLTILSERNWQRALEVYMHSDSRVQWACAPHVMRLIVFADVWHSPHSSDREALRPVLGVAIRAMGGEGVAEDVLRISLRRGMWATGIAFHQFLQIEQPELMRRNRRIEAYGTMLCKGLLSQSALTRTIAEVLKSARAANWAAASAAFVRYAEEEKDGNLQSDPSQKEITVSAVPSSSHTTALFPASVPLQLSHVAHTVRYSMFCTSGMWIKALSWFPPHTLPLPLHHRMHLQRLAGTAAVDKAVYGLLAEQTSHGTVLHEGSTTKEETAPALLPSPLSMSLVQIALQEKLHRTRTPTHKATVESVEQTLRVLERRGQWEQAMVVCEHALANRCFPHSAGSILLSACTSSWEVSLSCFAHLTRRMRPDAVTAALALKACVQGQQWVLALRILRQSVLTSTVPSPRMVDYAVKAALHAGAWSAALRIVRPYQNTRNPSLANTILHVYVQSECWNDAVVFFYDCVTRGMCPLDESLSMAIAASQAVSAEYRDAARVVGVIASALEDFCHIHGVVLQHVLIVCQGMSRGTVVYPHPDLSRVSLAHVPPTQSSW